MIEPTVGRIVWYRPHGPTGPTQAAIVAGVNSTHSVNLAVYSMYGESSARTGVHLKQSDEEAPSSEYCEWMPYQKGQAAKTEQVGLGLMDRVAALEGRMNQVI